MRICLINPPWITTPKNNIWNVIRCTMPPLGILYLASVLENEKYVVDILDFQAHATSWEEIEKNIKSSVYDFYGITATTPIVNNAYRISEIIKKYHPGSKVTLGGVHVTALPEEALNRYSVDYVIRGEAEDSFVNLVRAKPLKSITGISYKANNRIHHVNAADIIEDLDSLPFPAFHKVNLKFYRPALGSYRRLPAINMLTTRGCLGKCTFCNSANVPLRKRSAMNIFLEIDMLYNKYGIREISFYDDTFTVYQKNVDELCDLLIRNKINISWCCFARVDYVNLLLLKKMKAAGCHQIMYGVEAADNEILKNINKRIDFRKNKEVINMTRKSGITVRCTFMFGSPGETEETIERTIHYSLLLNPEIVVYNITTPYPGTEMFKWAKETGHLATENWNDYNLSEPVMKLPTVSSKVIKQKLKEAFKRFYFRPYFLFKKIFLIRSFWEIPLYIREFKRVYKFFRF